MARQYQPEELLRLRISPHVRKPPGLPPAEEWMGLAQEPSTRSRGPIRGKSEGSFSHDNTRPSLLDTRHLSQRSGNVPSDIILGPPKTAFASSTSLKTPNRPFDSPNRSAFGNFGSESARGDYFSSRLKHTSEKDKEDRPRESRLGGARAVRDDADLWSGPRSGRNFGTDEDRPHRRNGDRESEQETNEGRDGKRQHQKHVDTRHRDGDETRRNGNGRGAKNWLRDDESLEPQPKEGSRAKDWRDGERTNRRGFDSDWTRSTKAEQDPEWMAEAKSEDKKEKHTAQDLEQWKANMKAQAMGGRDEPKTGNANHTRNTSGTLPSKVKVDKQLALDSDLDKFFHIWKEPTTSQADHGGTEDHNREATRANAVKASRFTGFFGPKVAASQPQFEPLFSAPATSVTAQNDPVLDPTEDKKAFEKILRMLGTGSQNPASDDTPEHNTGRPPQSPTILSPRSRKAHGLENLLGMQTPNETSNQIPQNADSQFLLKLMKNNSIQTSHQPHGFQPLQSDMPQPDVAARYGMPNRPMEDGTSNRFYDNLDQARGHDKLNPTAPTTSRNQRQQLIYDDDDEDNSVYPPSFTMGIPSHAAPPPGLRGPPGLEAMHSGYGLFMQGHHHQQQQQQEQQQQQQQRGPVIPGPHPGFQAPSRNQNPNFPPGLMGMGNLNLNERAGPPFLMRGMGPAPGGPPPGFMPGPGGPPPPGFPPHMMGMPADPFFQGAGAGGRPPPVDMFDQGQFARAGGGPLQHGQFRRQE